MRCLGLFYQEKHLRLKQRFSIWPPFNLIEIWEKKLRPRKILSVIFLMAHAGCKLHYDTQRATNYASSDFSTCNQRAFWFRGRQLSVTTAWQQRRKDHVNRMSRSTWLWRISEMGNHIRKIVESIPFIPMELFLQQWWIMEPLKSSRKLLSAA